MFHTKTSERTADLCRSGRWVWDWGSMTGLDMTGAIWRLWLGGLGASCYWGAKDHVSVLQLSTGLYKQDAHSLNYFTIKASWTWSHAKQKQTHQGGAWTGNSTGMRGVSHYLNHSDIKLILLSPLAQTALQKYQCNTHQDSFSTSQISQRDGGFKGKPMHDQGGSALESKQPQAHTTNPSTEL